MSGLDPDLLRKVVGPVASGTTGRERNYTAERVLRALEVVVHGPTTAPALAGELAIDARTARRMLASLVEEEYVERLRRSGRGDEYHPTVRLLAMAARLAGRLPLLAAARRLVEELEAEQSAAAYVVVPAYTEVLVVAATGTRGIYPWTSWPANTDATGRALLAYRHAWRQSLPKAGTIDETTAAAIRASGHAIMRLSEACASVAVAVPADGLPIAALGTLGPGAPYDTKPLENAATRISQAARSLRIDPHSPDLTGLRLR